MKSLKITGTPGEPVRLGDLNPGTWYVRKESPYPDNNYAYPSCVAYHKRNGWTQILRQNESGTSADMTHNFVHPLTRHEHDDGTVEFRHVGEEVMGDTCPACNGTGVKPAPEPEPTYLERLPEAVREFIVDRRDETGGGFHANREAMARAIYKHRDAIFAAGEPVEAMSVHGTSVGSELDVRKDANRSFVHFVSSGSGSGHSVTKGDAVAFARRIVALASKGGAQ